jgi:hypothetical protein
MQKLQDHPNKWLFLNVVLAIEAGLLIGYRSAAWVRANQSSVGTLTTLAVFLSSTR